MRILDAVVLGAMLGAAFGVWNLLATWLDPLADGTPVALLIFYGPIFTAWGFAGFAAARRSGRVMDEGSSPLWVAGQHCRIEDWGLSD